MLYKLTYVFNTASGGTSWDTSLVFEADSVRDALRLWSRITTQFVLRNLTHVGVTTPEYDGRGIRFWSVCTDPKDLNTIKEFISSYAPEFA